MLRRAPPFLCLCLLLTLGGCTRSLEIDTRYTSANHDSRVQYIVVHYTSSGFDRALQHLTHGSVSSHYLISEKPTTYRLVDEEHRAWHAGDSSWQGRTWLNASSIGIEIVHPGYTDTAQGRLWHPWPEEQINALIPLLQDLLKRHKLSPDRVLGHSDIAPQRKVDPGPLFPWQRLAASGVSIWPDAEKVARVQAELAGQAPPLEWFAEALVRFGYGLEPDPQQIKTTTNVLAAFQMRFRPNRFDGQPDAQTAAILATLVPESMRSPLWCRPQTSPTTNQLPPCRIASPVTKPNPEAVQP
ncbi:N-acetylmuramoyl-L-alanine amidase [uncultured Halopseudomonas sp.]|uniref:N-acetylmuramoyl-L-alanine amidase n=1 Tax=uncultured Halopseudomonas sp. TaxID=2901193 RepID=UPI0030EF54A8|tara:strand:+ start:50638 stop:51534 length:897 start_codon:yes stop_codon:yes gene_type:complete